MGLFFYSYGRIRWEGVKAFDENTNRTCECAIIEPILTTDKQAGKVLKLEQWPLWYFYLKFAQWSFSYDFDGWLTVGSNKYGAFIVMKQSDYRWLTVISILYMCVI